MPIFIIAYDIKDEDPQAIRDELEKRRAKKLQLSVWLFESTKSSNIIYNHFLSYINKEKDKLFVCQLTGEAEFNIAFRDGCKLLNDKYGNL